MRCFLCNARRAVVGLVCIWGLVVAGLTPAGAAAITRVSVDSRGGQAHGDSAGPDVSADGRYVAFTSAAGDLVRGDANGGASDIFLRDRLRGTTVLVSVNSDGAQANGDCWGASLSADGRTVAFVSTADNLVADDTNGVSDVFVRDLDQGSTVRVSLDENGDECPDPSYDPALSADGQWVAFTADAPLVANDLNGLMDVYVHGIATGETACVSLNEAGGAPGGGDAPSISGDGTRIGFHSAWNEWAVYVLDRTSGEMIYVINAGDRVQATFEISADGQYVAYAGRGGFDAYDQLSYNVWVYNLATGEKEPISRSRDGETWGDLWSIAVDISADGRYIAFSTYAANFGPADTNTTDAGYDIYVHDRQTGRKVLATVTHTGEQQEDLSRWWSGGFALSGDGRFLAFDSVADNLARGDTNHAVDVFLSDLAWPPLPLRTVSLTCTQTYPFPWAEYYIQARTRGGMDVTYAFSVRYHNGRQWVSSPTGRGGGDRPYTHWWPQQPGLYLITVAVTEHGTPIPYTRTAIQAVRVLSPERR